ncbi:MAG: hypothetical protein ABW321_07680 [Polyangiales bacterium]
MSERREHRGQVGLRVAAGLLAGGCVGSAGAAPSLMLIALGALLGGVIGLWASGRQRVVWGSRAARPQTLPMPADTQAPDPAPRALRLERWVPLLTVLFFVPVVTRGVAPGADMAMHVSLARAILDGSHVLSPAWGAVTAEAYPRGFSAWVALIAGTGIDLGHASLIASGLAFALYYFGLRAFLRSALLLPYPSTLAAVLTFACWTPQAFFRWGGGPSVLAIAYGLVAAAQLAAAVGAGRGLALAGSALLAALCLVGAMWTHPIGAVMGAVLAGVALLVRGRHVPGRMLALGAAALLPLLPTMLWLSGHGPALSAYEQDWIRTFQDVNENVLGAWPRWLFPITVFRAVAVRLGVAISIVYVASCALQCRDPAGRRRVYTSIAVLELLGLVLAYGPHLPMIGFLIYPSRLMPLAVPAVAPPIAWAWATLCARDFGKRAVWPVVTGVVGLGTLVVHLGVVQLALPIATANDLRVVACFDRVAPPDVMVDGPYGDATQWLPALTGRAVTHPHIHCTLFDEVNAELAQRTPSYRFIGERLRYGDPLTTPVPNGQPICRAGGAALYRIPSSAAPPPSVTRGP